MGPPPSWINGPKAERRSAPLHVPNFGLKMEGRHCVIMDGHEPLCRYQKIAGASNPVAPGSRREYGITMTALPPSCTRPVGRRSKSNVRRMIP